MRSTLDRIVRLFNRPSARAAQPPVVVDGAIPTFALSIDRHTPLPERLVELALHAIQAVSAGQVDLDDLLRRDGVQEWITIWPGEHYLLLAAVVRKLQPRVVIEIGTDTGTSALAMGKYLPPDGRIVTFDIAPWQELDRAVLRDDDFRGGQLEQRLADLADPAVFERHRGLLEAAEFLFIDGPKNTTFEYALMRNLRTIRFARPPILLFDDTKLASMLKFWHELPYPKLDLTSFGHWSGSGLVELTPTPG